MWQNSCTSYAKQITLLNVLKEITFDNIFQVPELAGFWLLTLLLQLPLIIMLLFNEAALILPFERAVHIVEALFVVFEIIIGYVAIRTMVNYQVTKFHLRQFTDLEQMPDNEYWLDESEHDHDHYS